MHVFHPREIIDRRHLSEELDAYAERDVSDDDRRGYLVERLKAALKSGADGFRACLEGGSASGADAVDAHSFLMDQLIRV